MPPQTFRPLLQQQDGIDAEQLSGHNYKCTKKWRNGQAVTDCGPRKGRGYAERERKTIRTQLTQEQRAAALKCIKTERPSRSRQR